MQSSIRERKASKETDAPSQQETITSGTQTGLRKIIRGPHKTQKSPRKSRSTILSTLQGLLVCCLLALVCVTIAGVSLFIKQDWTDYGPEKPREITPLPVQRVSDLPQFHGKHRERMYWGTYRSSLYLGIRARTPQSILAGLMWLGMKEGQTSLRHICEESDGLSRYSWVRHDGETYGRQEIVDQGLLITTSFLKSREPGSGYGGDWSVRILARPKKSSEKQPSNQPVSLFFYIANEDGSPLTLWPKTPSHIRDGPLAAGKAKEIGGWELHTKGKKGATLNYLGLSSRHTHKLTELVWEALEGHARKTSGALQLPNESENLANIAVFQVTGEAPIELDFVFVSGTLIRNARVKGRVGDLSGVELTKRLREHEESFELRFESTFKLKNKVEGEREIEVGRVALSNLLGSIGYSYGESRIAIPHYIKGSETRGLNYWHYWPTALYTAVPSRTSFPRGFLADEGYHQLLISQWDRKVSKDIIAHWLDTINSDGWIPRQQVLGDESRSKVPDGFDLQHTNHADPPTLFLVLNKIASQYEASKEGGQEDPEDRYFLKAVFPRLEAWFQWFNMTQTGKVAGSYYWHGRDGVSENELNPKTVMSGMDDYPRASHPSDDERHIDLRCWMAFAAKTMAQVAAIVHTPCKKYQNTRAWLTNLELLNKLHYEEQFGRYLDYGNHTEMVQMYKKKIVDTRTGYVQLTMRRLVMEPPELGWVPHYGYNSLFPMLMHILPSDSEFYGHQLILLSNELYLWTKYGLRSLASSSSIYTKHNTEHFAPFWRGPVWININYLVLAALKFYSQEPGPYKEQSSDLYKQLRENICRNVVEKYHESGYLWESYNDNTNNGEGKGSHPFTGWTSLILLIMAEIY